MIYNAIQISYQIGGNNCIATSSNQHVEITCDSTNKSRMKVAIVAKCDIKLVKATLFYDHNYKQDDVVFVNGYQSWTYSREYCSKDIQYGLKNLSKIGAIKSFIDFCGDYKFVDYSEKEGQFHSFSYGYIRSVEKMYFIGSISERFGWTIIKYKMHNSIIEIDKDIQGVSLATGDKYNLYDLLLCEGSYDEVFDRYFSVMEIPKPKFSRLHGYTSWYNYFGKISEDIILRDLNGLKRLGNKAQIFQIDDGYQSAVGDWLDIKRDKFPNGMEYIADKIHQAGYKAGIWLAPTLCQRTSKIAKTHPDWLIKTSGKWKSLGGVAWGGAYILDLEKPQVKEYLAKVFDVMLNEWGYDLVKLDFLYSSCLYPRNNKSRGQLMQETMEFFRQCVGDKMILGCGVPLASCFGLVDMCRVGCDVDLTYKPRFWTKITNQEIVCTQNAITNTIFRRHLDGRAFVLDPDVFFVREGNLKFTAEQKEILQKVNSLMGGVLFVSDNIGGFNDQQLRAIEEIFTSQQMHILDARWVGDGIFAIEYVDKNKNKVQCRIDLKKGEFV